LRREFKCFNNGPAGGAALAWNRRREVRDKVKKMRKTKDDDDDELMVLNLNNPNPEKSMVRFLKRFDEMNVGTD
jgi:hypothetical protein